MPVPKRKTSKSRRDKRSASKGLRPHSVHACMTCSSPLLSHQVCDQCGYYKGVKVLRTKADRHGKRQEARAQQQVSGAASGQEPVDVKEAQ